MRIMHISQNYPPMISGQSLTMQALVRGLGDLGHQNFVYTASENGKSSISEKSRLTIRRTKSYNNPVRVGQRYYFLPLLDFRHHLNMFRPDVIHVHDPTTPTIMGVLGKRLRKVPGLITIQQVPWFLTNRFDNTRLLKYSLDYLLWAYIKSAVLDFEQVIAPSIIVGNIVEQHISRPVGVISNGVNLANFSSSTSPIQNRMFSKIGLIPKLPIILHVGQLNAEKKVEVVLYAAAKVIRSIDSQVLIVGDGKRMDYLKKLITKLGLNNRCFFSGYIHSREDLAAVYSFSDVFVTASEIETQGIVLLEAAASGLPIVAANATAIPEIVINGKNGYLFSPGDANEASSKILAVFRSKDLSEKMALHGKEIAQIHDFRNTIKKYMNEYQNLISLR